MVDFLTPVYLVSPIEDRKGVYAVAKMVEGFPEDVFNVTIHKDKSNCTCRGFRYTPGEKHKHIRLVKEAIRLWQETENPYIALWFEPTRDDPHAINHREFARDWKDTPLT